MDESSLFCVELIDRYFCGGSKKSFIAWPKGRRAVSIPSFLGEIMSVISIQESFLNVALTAGKHVTVHLLNGAKVYGCVRSFDKYSIVLETSTLEQLIFKHSVSALHICCKNKHCSQACHSGY